jgi:hypothetical protein
MGPAVSPIARVDRTRSEPPAPVIHHSRFGAVRGSFRRECSALIWECLDLVPTQRGAADLEFEADAWGPTSAHERQLDAIVGNLDALTKAASQTAAAEFGGAGLEWQGARLTGRDGIFQLHYWRTSGPELLITVSFEQSRPVSIHLHD